jgi:subtilisin-like proprotein convertase family protein
MKKILLLVIFITSMSTVFGQRNNSWQFYASDKAITSEKVRETTYSANQKLLQFNAEQFKQTLANVAERASGQPGVEIQLPNTQGKFESFLIWESSNFAPELQAQFPEIRAYVGQGVTDPTALLNLSFSPQGIQTMVFRADSGSEFIEPYTKDRSVYVVFDSKTRTKSALPFVCSTEDVAMANGLRQGINQVQANDQVYRTMRLALSCTGEYGVYHGGAAGALAAMNATMTRCNGVFERDLAVKLIIIANNNLVIYTNANTDPYSPASSMNNWNAQLQTTLTNIIGEANYDIGHLFGATGGGGSAGCIGCVCVDGQKGRGITSPADGVPMGDTFDIDYVAHELGHQMGANHTFTHTGENNAVNVEPGSGSTIMAYAGIGGDGTDMQNNSDDYFTYRSILQIQTNLIGKTCPVSTIISGTNPRPTVSAGGSFTIPVSTAFKLTGSGSDTAGQTLTYCWEQNNDATVVGLPATFPSPTKTDGPNWRSRVPSASPVRFMPPFQNVLNGQLVNTWETVSSVARTLTFTLTVRDNVLGGGQTNTGVMAVTVVDAGGAFAITNPSVENVSWAPGSTQTVTWNVAGTTANGINTANVNILFSTNGGATFTTLVSNTPNDGSQTITLPSTPAQNCRLMIEAVGNIFYAVSKNIGLGYTFTSTCNTYSNNANLVIPDGTGANIPGATVAKNITVPTSSGTISDVNVTLAGTHSYYGDLIVAMNHPDGTQVALLNRNCNDIVTTGFNVLFNDASPAIVCAANLNGTFAPSGSLSAYNGKSIGGTWTLLANDNFNVDTGSIGTWSIEICSTTATLNTPENTLSDFKVFPNPNNGNFTIQFSNATTSDIEVSVFDMRGRKIFENTYSNEGAFNENIQLSNAQTGIYLVSVTDGVNKIVKRIAVE